MAGQGHALRVSSKGGNVLQNPTNGQVLIFESGITGYAILLRLTTQKT